MNTEQILYEALKTTGYKVFPQKANQNQKNPVVIYNVTSDGFEYGLNNYLDNENTRFQIDVYADGYSEILIMKANVIQAVRDITDAKPIVYSSTASVSEDGRRIKIEVKLWTNGNS